MSEQKKIIRAKFRASVFDRDGFKCRMCGYRPKNIIDLDAHHITGRSSIIGGGYVSENGISLCSICHIRAEKFHKDNKIFLGYSPEDLYNKIESSFEIAEKASKRLDE